MTSTGPSTAYRRGSAIEFHFCASCGCLGHYRAVSADEQGRRRMAVNLRMVDDPDAVSDLVIRHFDGLDSFTALPGDHRRVRDLWF